MKSFHEVQREEAMTWLIEDEKERKEKALRESIRYPLLKKQMGLNNLDTSWMTVFDIGAGPLGGVSSVINCKKVVRVDPLAKEYSKYFPCQKYLCEKAEDLDERLGEADLIIVTNALDHFENPDHFLRDVERFSKYSAYFAHFHAINNAITHPHEAHCHNFNPEMIKENLSSFECDWYMDFQNDGLTYGWRFQPAFSGLYRKVTK